VIAEVEAALRTLLDPLLPDGAAVRLGPPPPERGCDVLNLFLAEVRQDTRAMSADWDDVRDEGGLLVGRRPPARRFELCYLATGWSTDERRRGEILDAVLLGVTPEQRLDPSLLAGSLAGSSHPVLVRFAGSAASLHQAHGFAAQTVIGLVVSAPLVRPLDTELAGRAERITVTMDQSVRRRAPVPVGRKPGAWASARIVEQATDPAREDDPVGKDDVTRKGDRDGASGEAK
jgi:hypothetical protein